MTKQIDTQWQQTYVADMGGTPVAVMVCEHGESYTQQEWASLSDTERNAAKDRHNRFHWQGKYL